MRRRQVILGVLMVALAGSAIFLQWQYRELRRSHDLAKVLNRFHAGVLERVCATREDLEAVARSRGWNLRHEPEWAEWLPETGILVSPPGGALITEVDVASAPVSVVHALDDDGCVMDVPTYVLEREVPDPS